MPVTYIIKWPSKSGHSVYYKNVCITLSALFITGYLFVPKKNFVLGAKEIAVKGTEGM